MDEFESQLERHIMNSGRTPMLMYYLVENDPCPYVDKEGYYLDTLDGLVTVNEYDPMQLHGVKTREELEELARGIADRDWEKVSNPPPLKAMKMSIDPRELGTDKEDIEASEGFVRWFDMAENRRKNALGES